MKFVKFTLLEANHIRDALRELQVVESEYMDMITIEEASEIVEAALENLEDEPIE